jgi:O-antigen/teichoic acid export membrane protein
MLVVSTFLINAVFNFALGLLIARFLGPEGFGQYAIAASAALVLNVLFLDWIRLAATRFYSNRSRAENPAVRGTLDAIFALSSIGVALTAAIAIALGFDLGLMTGLAALAPAMAICNGLFDYHTALARARFEERSYSLMVILKNVLSLALMAGGAWWLQSPTAVAAGFILSVAATVMTARRRLLDPAVTILAPDAAQARQFFLYAFPVIFAALIYFVIPLWNRAAIASHLGFAQSGQFSLSYDIGVRVVQTVGSALDILLFQIALKAEDENGLDEAKAQLSANMGIVLACIAAVAAGYWLVLPAFEAVLVPGAYQGSFASITVILLPGLACFALIQAAISPVFQLKRRTFPLIIAACIALAVNALLTWRLGADATVVDYARAQAFGYGAAMVTAIVLALREMQAFPSVKDVAGAIAATAVMVAAVWPLRAMAPGLPVLLASVAIGALAFAATAWLLNLAGLRDALKAGLRRD